MSVLVFCIVACMFFFRRGRVRFGVTSWSGLGGGGAGAGGGGVRCGRPHSAAAGDLRWSGAVLLCLVLAAAREQDGLEWSYWLVLLPLLLLPAVETAVEVRPPAPRERRPRLLACPT
jgi:hypothetical protein